VKVKDNDMLVIYIYVDDIIFCATNESICKEFSNCMKKRVQNEHDG